MLSGDDFAAVLKSRERSRSPHFSLQWRAGTAPASRLGLVLPKKLARTSVRRNLIKRQSRSLFRVWSEGRVAGAGGNGGAVDPIGAGGLSGTGCAVIYDVVLKITAKVAGLDRRVQFGELSGLILALPRA